MGAQAGQLEAKAGVKHGLCVNQQPENPVLGQRCAGYIAALQAAGGSGKTLSIPPSESTNPTAIQQAIAGGLSADSKIDGVFTLGTDEADAALRAIGSRPIKVGTTDLSVNVLNEVKSGKLLFAIDQQPYLQGYYSVLVGVQNALYGVHPVGAITTGPLVVTQSNVDTVLSAQQKYAVRGAS
jgi:simple sugar transport system substrate-binding protein